MSNLFFKFLKIAFSSDASKNLTNAEKNTLFLLTKNELRNHIYGLTNIEDLKMLYERFNVFLRVKQANRNTDVLALIADYADRIVKAKINLDGNIDQLDWHFTNLFWVLNINFYNYIEKDISYLDFRNYFDSLQKMNNEIRRWDADSIFSLRSVLGTYRSLRTNLQDNSAIVNFLDKTTQSYVSNIIESAENQCFSLTVNEIKECVFIEYIKNLSNSEKNGFKNLYEIVDKQQVFPNKFNYRSGEFEVIVFFQQLTEDEKTIIKQAINQTYGRVNKLKSDLGLDFKEPIKNQTFRLYIFKNNDEYVKYGPLWGVNTAGGGYAHVRAPSENDRQMRMSTGLCPMANNGMKHLFTSKQGILEMVRIKKGGISAIWVMRLNILYFMH